MKTKKHGFVPSLDGRLEDRIVLNGAHGSGGVIVTLPGGERTHVPREAILTTRTYNNVLVNVHRATQQFGRTQGVQRDYDVLSRQLGKQLGRLPYARQDGLVDYVNDSLQFYAPSESRQLYHDIRSTAVSFLSFKVLNGEAAIRKSPGHFFSDADIYGRHAAIFNQNSMD
ncbi:hypothetical protein [Planctomyces sp. SH-PL62]|uniref:hypothetical protein n=1 Tax=Planctomyces sp. SH-PL62 TaxID=1636152 RepID=UPI00078CABA1|nr:hypothetical protein [Planctomyces sp. SH-PL62]AMV37858.1 hypothetical protein VT85_10500 [Planctomyces sp. SH-PL62]